MKDPLPGDEHIDALLARSADALAHQPWMERFLCVLRNVIPICSAVNDSWYIRDARGDALPLAKGEHWQLLALSGGHPVNLASEWDGESLLPLGIMTGGAYYMLGRPL